jgi:hypothetical protein
MDVVRMPTVFAVEVYVRRDVQLFFDVDAIYRA